MLWAYAGHQRSQWDHTSAILAGIMAVAGGKYEPREFHPYEQADHAAIKDNSGMKQLRRFFASGGFNGRG